MHSDSESNDDLLAPNTYKRIGRPPKKRKRPTATPQKSDEFKGVGDVERLDTRKGHAQGELDVLEIRPDVGLSLV